MDEFSPGLLSEKRSNVLKKSTKKVQLKADVKLRIKQRLLRDKGKKNCAGNHRGTVSSFEDDQEANFSLPNHNSTMKNGSKIATVAEKLWRMKRNPHLHNEKFVFSGRVPCFLKRNIKKVDQNKRGRFVRSIKRKKRTNAEYLSLWHHRKPAKNPNATKEFYFRYKPKNAKRPASGTIENGRAKRFCFEARGSKADRSEDLAKTSRSKSVNARRRLRPFEVSQGTGNESFDRKQTKTATDARKNSSPKIRAPRDGPYGRPRKRSLSKGCMNHGNFNSDVTESKSIPEDPNRQEEQSGIIQRNLAGKNANENTRNVINKDVRVKVLKVSLTQCFANGLRARENFTQGSFLATSTPKAIRVPTTNSQDVPISRKISKASTSHISPRVLTSDITSKGPTSDRSSRLLATSDFTPRVLKSQVAPTLPSLQITPPESEASCTEEERSMSTRDVEFGRHDLRRRLSGKNKKKKTCKEIKYKPLFSNKPRQWMSVVVENDG